MRFHLTKIERIAALTVLSMSAGVAAAGVALMRRQARYLAKRAAAAFRDDELDPLVWPEGAVWENAAEPEENEAHAKVQEETAADDSGLFTDPVTEG